VAREGLSRGYPGANSRWAEEVGGVLGEAALTASA